MLPNHIAVIGGGISGLASAIALHDCGSDVTVYESTSEWGEVGAGITLSPNAMKGLDFIGAGESIAKAGMEPSSQHISHWKDGRLLLSIDRQSTFQTYKARYVYIHRADLHQILRNAVDERGIEVRLGKRLSNLGFSDTKVRLEFANGTKNDADFVVGADGLKSCVRKLFNPAAPHFTGHVAYRALAPATPEIDALVSQPGMHIGPGKMVVRYPLRKGELLNLVFFARQDGWTEDGWSIPASPHDLDRLYDDWCPAVRSMIAGIDHKTLFKWAINAHHPLSTWVANGKVTLVGDAAHAMTPFLGQGAATGIEDAVILARCVGAEESLSKALARYQAARYQRTAFIQAESNANADRLQGSDTDMYGLGNLRNEETLGLFRYDCTTEPI
jgi:salicylate hydroxylase